MAFRRPPPSALFPRPRPYRRSAVMPAGIAAGAAAAPFPKSAQPSPPSTFLIVVTLYVTSGDPLRPVLASPRIAGAVRCLPGRAVALAEPSQSLGSAERHRLYLPLPPDTPVDLLRTPAADPFLPGHSRAADEPSQPLEPSRVLLLQLCPRAPRRRRRHPFLSWSPPDRHPTMSPCRCSPSLQPPLPSVVGVNVVEPSQS